MIYDNRWANAFENETSMKKIRIVSAFLIVTIVLVVLGGLALAYVTSITITPIPEDEGVLLVKSTPEYQSLVNKFGSNHVSVKAVNLEGKSETDFLAKISDGFLMEPGCIIVLRAGGGAGYVYQLDEEFNIVFRMTLDRFEEGILNLDVRIMEHFYGSLQ